MRAWRYKSLWLLATIVVTVAAAFALLLPGQYVPNIPISNDYLKHVAGFFLLTLWYLGLFRRSNWARFMLCLMVFGAASELLQYLTRFGRQQDLLDVIANTAGIGAGWLVARLGGDRWPVLAESVMARLW